MSKVAVYVGEQKLFASENNASVLFDSGTVIVHDGSGTPFVYVFRPGQYAKVKAVNGLETVNIDE